MSLKVKIMIGILIGALLIFTVFLVTKTDNKQNDNASDLVNDLVSAVKKLPDKQALDFICNELSGYWTSDNQFLAFINSDEYQMIEYGLYQTSYSVNSEIKASDISGENSFSLTIFIPATPPTGMDEARPERTEKIYIDVSNYHIDNRINIKIENLGDGQWHTYEYGGKSLSEAYSD